MNKRLEVHAARMRSRNRKRAHGLTSTYQYGCRCRRCRAANAAYSRWYRNESI